MYLRLAEIDCVKNQFFSSYDNLASYPPQNRVTNNYGSKSILGGL